MNGRTRSNSKTRTTKIEPSTARKKNTKPVPAPKSQKKNQSKEKPIKDKTTKQLKIRAFKEAIKKKRLLFKPRGASAQKVSYPSAGI